MARGIDEIQQRVQAVLVSAEMADRLLVDKGAAALGIVRRYLDSAGETFEVSIRESPFPWAEVPSSWYEDLGQ